MRWAVYVDVDGVRKVLALFRFHQHAHKFLESIKCIGLYEYAYMHEIKR
jgi:hypothetical protein